MDIMTIFDIIILLFGIYTVYSALQMKKSGVINSVVITSEEIVKCRDAAGFIECIYRKEVIFGAIVAFSGLLGIVNDRILSFSVLDVAQMVIFLAAFFWFQYYLRRARGEFF